MIKRFLVLLLVETTIEAPYLNPVDSRLALSACLNHKIREAFAFCSECGLGHLRCLPTNDYRQTGIIKSWIYSCFPRFRAVKCQFWLSPNQNRRASHRERTFFHHGRKRRSRFRRPPRPYCGVVALLFPFRLIVCVFTLEYDPLCVGCWFDFDSCRRRRIITGESPGFPGAFRSIRKQTAKAGKYGLGGRMGRVNNLFGRSPTCSLQLLFVYADRGRGGCLIPGGCWGMLGDVGGIGWTG